MNNDPSTNDLEPEIQPSWSDDAVALLRVIAQGTAGVTGQTFFDMLVQHVAAALNVHAVFVTECLLATPQSVRELASLEAGMLIATSEYAVAGLPCELVLEGREYFVPRELAKLFPAESDRLAESYIGLPLLSSVFKVIGHLVVVDRKPMPEDTQAANVLRIFAARAASELERQRAVQALSDSEARYRGLFESNPLPVLVCDAQTLEITGVNMAAVALYGYSEEVFCKLKLADLTEPPGANPLEAHRHRSHDGRVIDIEASVYSLDLGGQPATVVLVSDVTQRRKLEIERTQTMVLLESRVKTRTREIERRQQVAESLRDTLSILNSRSDLEHILAFIVEQAAQLLGLDAGAICGLFETDGSPSIQGAQGLEQQQNSIAQAAWFRFVLEEATRSREPISVPDVPGAFGQTSPFRAVLVAPILIMDEVKGCLALFSLESRDFFEEERVLVKTFAEHSALALENARLREQASRMAVLEERERLSRELHDSVTQSLYSLTLFAETGRRQAEKGDVNAAKQHLEMLRDTAQQTLKEMRLMLHELRPSALETEGLVAALRRRLDAVEERAGVLTNLEANLEHTLDVATEDQLFLIAQEALNNALRHARAKTVKLKLELNTSLTGTASQELQFEIADDGHGFDTTLLSNGIGLTAMRRRAEKLGGRLEIESHPGQGTRVRVFLPYPPVPKP
jgi:PAS domain S-box-containing protein